ncbi:YceK/YidQ family lipoprotein [Microbulbifer sp. 2205BS26-8]|uniref:YceK/YidQ family lipoprotein n=1 Tax=Microbulbifer sp. 2205BS26-8 TaxID=3064386 RepID=UPI00273F41C6|nr:YceK/YidQ family lipoprotein [Microbulbifer sp. 2205BS26-8]MDP5210652.1 YceK/YidQ family lipoprotein [Microbulbifer sp. 2205BS26-8]
MRKIYIIVFSLIVTGCGTFTSLSSSDNKIASTLKRQKTQCEETSRAYGGVSYNLCKLNSNPGYPHFDWALGFYVLDIAACTITDTVVLPYTIVEQHKKGSIRIKS